MMVKKVPFRIDFPIKILHNSKKVNFSNRRTRDELFKRNIYYHLYKGKVNHFLQKRAEVYENISQKVVQIVKNKYPGKKILNVSIFGSSLFSQKPGDFDFLVIIEGNKFSLIETIVKMNSNKNQRIGISIKGIDNFVYGVRDSSSPVSKKFQNQIIYRTASALFRRHLPIKGYDFIENKKTFERNIRAQISDLLNNTYELYYLKNKKKNISNKERSKKILSRIYEASAYLNLELKNDVQLKKLKKEIYFSIHQKTPLKSSKKLFDKLNLIFNKLE